MTSKYDELSRTKYCAFLCLERKAYTVYEMRQKLLKKDYSAECVEQAVTYLQENGYLNDRDYAQRYANDAVELKKHGTMRIKNDLRRKGIAPELIEAVLADLEIENTDTIKRILERKLPGIDLTDPKQKNRLVGYLLRRGYKYNEIFSALREYTEDEGAYWVD